MKIVFFDVKESWEREIIAKSFPKDEVVVLEDDVSKAKKDVFDADVISVFIYSKCDSSVLSKFSNLKMIGARSTGFDHIDTLYCKKRGISVFNVPHYGENTVAEFTFGLLLAISRKIIESVDRVREGEFSFSGLRGFDLAGKTIGVVGFGNIGQKFAKMCSGFEMKVLIFDVNSGKLSNKVNEVKGKFVSLEEIFKSSDVISLHLPLLPSTKHILSKKAFSKMKKGVVILNTARGDLIDSQALVDAIEEGVVSYAGLDVLEGECMIKDEIELLNHNNKKKCRKCDMKVLIEDHILINKKNVYVTPHNAFNTQDALERILKTTIENIEKKVKENRVC